jgi:hypothetical protein
VEDLQGIKARNENLTSTSRPDNCGESWREVGRRCMNSHSMLS